MRLFFFLLLNQRYKFMCAYNTFFLYFKINWCLPQIIKNEPIKWDIFFNFPSPFFIAINLLTKCLKSNASYLLEIYHSAASDKVKFQETSLFYWIWIKTYDESGFPQRGFQCRRQCFSILSMIILIPQKGLVIFIHFPMIMLFSIKVYEA